MKNLKKYFTILLMTAVFMSCSKSSNSPGVTTTIPLVKQSIITYPNIRVVFDYTYDAQKRLINTGTNGGIITYNTGGFESISTFVDQSKLITDVTLQDGHIATVLSYSSANERYNSTFSYDSKGRLAKILQTRTYNGQVIYHLAFTYSWDDNDNLVNSYVVTDSGEYNVTYSDFLQIT